LLHVCQLALPYPSRSHWILDKRTEGREDQANQDYHKEQ
jgi:hypothetical protein